MLELALKYPPELFARGTLQLQWPPMAYVAAVLAIGLAVAIVLGSFGSGPPRRRRDRAGLWALRTALLALLLFVLLDPRLVVETEDPIRGHVTVLLDDSLSMRILDQDGAARSQFVRSAFTPGTGSVAKELERRFDTRYLKFSNTVEPLATGDTPAFAGARSDLAGALRQLTRTPDAGALAAVVLVTDGAVGDSSTLDDAMDALRASGVTLHAVGVGAGRLSPDLEISQVQLPRRVLRGDVVEANIIVAHRGLGGKTVTVTVEEESTIVKQQPLTLPASDRPVSLRIPLEFNEAGPRRVVVRASPQPGELVAENNALHRTVDVRAEPVRILHIEGEPRFEVKFLRRAVARDEAVHVVSLVRTAENKYYRLGVDNADELAGGLPATEEALFRYDALVIGSIGNDLLDGALQDRIREFVARRGGGLVLLGGRRAFAEGGYSDSAIAGIAPVVLPDAASVYRARVPVRPSREYHDHPLLRVSGSESGDTVWTKLPPLTVVNPIRRAKPGATTLLWGDDGSGEPLVILAWQRYGRGTVAAFPVRDSWRWQMHAEVPLDDRTHEQLWRNLLRHVARPAGGRARLEIHPAEAAAGEKVRIDVETLNARYLPSSSTGVTLEVTDPLGEVNAIPLDRNLDRDGAYSAGFVPGEIGRYEFFLELPGGDGKAIETRASMEVSGAGSEFHSAAMDAARLTRIAGESGGRFFRASEAVRIPDVIDDATASVRVQKRLPLRDAPGLLIALILLACLEWIWRRRRSLA